MYELGIEKIPNSVSLWVHYLTFRMDLMHDKHILRK